RAAAERGLSRLHRHLAARRRPVAAARLRGAPAAGGRGRRSDPDRGAGRGNRAGMGPPARARARRVPLPERARAARGSRDWLGEREERRGGRVERAVQVAGGASKEAWAVDTDREELLVRRARPSVIHELTLPLRDEHALLEVMYATGVKVPRPAGYLGELGGHEAFAMERVRGETIGRRVVSLPELEEARRALPLQMAEQLAP